MSRGRDVKRVMIIVRDFPPYYPSLGGVLRAVKLAEFLTNNGWDVHVVAAKGEPISYSGYEPLVKKLKVYYVEHPLRRLSNRKTLRAAGQEDLPVRGRLAQTLVDDLIVPDMSVLFVRRLYKVALQMIEQHGIRNVFVSSPPHSTQLIGLMLKRKLGNSINLIVDYRDSWNCTPLFSKRNPLSRLVSQYLEVQVLKAAGHFVYVSPPILKKINRRYFDVTKKSHLIMNGFDPAMRPIEKTEHLANPRLTIGCFGRINTIAREGRDPTRFLDAVSELELPIRVVFYGYVEDPNIWTARFKNNVDIRGNLPHMEAIEEMQRMDLLLLLFSQIQGADEVISGRIFDYMLTERPILVVGPKDMEAGRIVTNRKLGFHLDINDKQAMADGLTEIYHAWRQSTLPSYRWTDLKEFSRPYQFAKLLPILV